jgi:transcription initiation factor TFIIIB Brf1 subunit/transcription initiation factor TFIIB
MSIQQMFVNRGTTAPHDAAALDTCAECGGQLIETRDALTCRSCGLQAGGRYVSYMGMKPELVRGASRKIAQSMPRARWKSTTFNPREAGGHVRAWQRLRKINRSVAGPGRKARIAAAVARRAAAALELQVPHARLLPIARREVERLGRANDRLRAVVVLLLACREQRVTCSLKAICGHLNTSRARVLRLLQRTSHAFAAPGPAHYLPQLASKIGLPAGVVAQAREMLTPRVLHAVQMRNPVGIAAGLLYISAVGLRVPVVARDAAAAAGVTEATLRAARRKIISALI